MDGEYMSSISVLRVVQIWDEYVSNGSELVVWFIGWRNVMLPAGVLKRLR